MAEQNGQKKIELRDPGKLTWRDKMDRFLWFCAGAKHDIIVQCPTDHVKYAGIGATVLSTGLLAFFSGSYALYTVFDNIAVALLFGALWAFTIFSLDRYMVSSIKKEGKIGKEILTALPRILIAIAIAMVISNPIELRLFNKEIEFQKTLDAIELEKQSIINSPFTSQIDSLSAELLENNQEIANRRDKIQILYDSLTAEIQGRTKTRLPGRGLSARSIESHIDSTKSEIALYINNDKSLRTELDSLEQARKLSVETILEGYSDNNGFLQQNLTLVKIRENSFANMAFYFVMLLILLIETAPIIVKIISGKGAYDSLLQRMELVQMTMDQEQTDNQIIQNMNNLKSVQLNQLDVFESIRSRSTDIASGDQKITEHFINEHFKLQKFISRKFREMIKKN